MSERFFTSEKKYTSIESIEMGFKVVKAYKLIKDGNTSVSEDTKTFTTLKEAEVWVNE